MCSWSSQSSLAWSKTTALGESFSSSNSATRRSMPEHLVLAVRPAQQREVVHERLRQVAELAEVAHRRGAVPLAELAALGAEHHGVVGEGGDRRAEGPEQQQLARRVGEVVVAADDVRDAHVAVVDHRGEVVAGGAVGAHDDEVADGALLDHNGAADDVVDGRRRRPARGTAASTARGPPDGPRPRRARGRGSAGRSAACGPRPSAPRAAPRGVPASRSRGTQRRRRRAAAPPRDTRPSARSGGTARKGLRPRAPRPTRAPASADRRGWPLRAAPPSAPRRCRRRAARSCRRCGARRGS